jgi:type II secretory pathway pseudopilin PulG
MRRSADSDTGFSLVETLVASALLIAVLTGVAQLVEWSMERTRDGGLRSRGLVGAQDKLEQLRAAVFSTRADGSAVTDAALNPTPPGSLDADMVGHVDYLDIAGRIVRDPADALLRRRWAIAPVDGNVPAALAIDVCTFRSSTAPEGRAAALACVSTIRVRQP